MPLACELHRGKTKRAGHAARDNPALPSLCSAARTRVPGCHASSQSPPPAQSRGRGPPRDCLSAVTRRGYAPQGASFAAPNRRKAGDRGPPCGFAAPWLPPPRIGAPQSPQSRRLGTPSAPDSWGLRPRVQTYAAPTAEAAAGTPSRLPSALGTPTP